MAHSVVAPRLSGRLTVLRVASGFGWTAVVLASLYFLQRDALRYLDYSPEGFRHHWDLRAWLIPHILGAGPALLAAPLQFSSRLRSRWPAFHRALGRVYVAGSLVAAPAAFRLALGSRCELCVPPLAILALLWFATTAIALIAARRRAFALHRQFMVRSCVLMGAFVVIRLTDFVPLPLPIEDEESRRSVFEWLCWVVPLLLTEAWLTWIPSIRRALASPSRASVAASSGAASR
jgi:uncharacterized membrane protein